ncbi:phosphatidylglycerol:prolipoprotein diacylglycerol transferase [Pontibacter ummariensis]|uniref:Phosphatidylglycerol:prolipoprotein diacylglycerol transferase n=1 Tax=Pontibacter ummariensis TaxID=1610492 RepID=A0A239EQR5_9BACT|nr:prolipoprotein diacylglyceryl transferase family protein [Pontibacter ummariensis]PRY12793.1 phosphatidylglycerol:prolipoprotein diacylglycerol transferase [Pontibacter ummariensis]SNS47016.1 phosphatidylglycerol:prolipoprotein diacylglycerol transferase [Pontibacter ummariensis]
MDKKLFIINAQGGVYFDLIYILVFLLGVGWLLIEGSRRRFHSVAWMVGIAATWFLFILGTKLFTYSGAEWKALLMGQHLPPTYNKVLFGGLLLSFIGFVFLKKLLHFKSEVLDAFAVLLPLAVGMQRIGCLLAGCCHGKLTGTAWGVQYAPLTLPHYHQFHAGLLPPGQFYSLPVHPTQLYELIAGILVVTIVLSVRRFIKAPGNLFVCSIALYSCFRFFIEFYRDTAAHAAGGILVGELKVVQWILLFVIGILGTLFIYREKTFNSVKRQDTTAAPSSISTGTLLLCLLFATWSLKNWFSYAEFVALHTALLPAMAVVSLHVFKAFTVPQYRWLTAGILVIPVFLMSQAFPNLNQDSVEVKSYQTVKIGYGSGDYYNSHDIGYGSGCDRVSNTSYFQQEYEIGGAGYAITKQKEKEALTYGINAYAGKHTETDITQAGAGISPSESITLAGVNPFVQYDTRWLGLGAGLHVGNLFYTTEDLEEDGTGIPESGGKKPLVYPQAHVRIGPTHIFFIDFRLAEHFPSAMPGLRYQGGIGSGFGLKNGTFVKVGSTGTGTFVTGNLVIDNRFVLEPLYLWDPPLTIYPDLEYKRRQFSVGLHYRFNIKEEKVLKQ